MLDAVEEAQRDEARGVRRSGNRNADRQYQMAYRMQTSVPELMDLSKEPDSVFELYGPESRKPGHLCSQLPAGAAAGRTERPVHPALSPRLGPAQRSAARPGAAVRGHRPADGGAHHRPEAARPARRHARGVGRRVRPHGVQPGQADRRELRPRSPSAQLLHVGRRRRHEARRPCSARPTTSATTSSRIRCRSTTCRPRSCTCSGIDHTKLTYRFQGRDFRLTDVHGEVVKKMLA